jgi:hypothetical protein
MPRFDGTGPAGMGPMTGGGRGWCNPYAPTYRGYAAPEAPYPARPPAYQPGYAAGYGYGRPRWGLRRGFGGRGFLTARGRGRGRRGGRW